ncbi:MAG TPA: CesT family type III secretion system chaperone [Polyangiaceae bacterium]|nr:CesT family type III secretion system chaperone [Polyangiaceae bacterium]
MIQSSEDLTAYLTRLERRFERLENGTFVLTMGANRPLVALRLEPPLLVVRVEMGRAPAEAESSQPLFKRLLELNVSSLLHAAYGLQNGNVVLSAALPLESLDLAELEGVLADVDLAVAEHVPALSELLHRAHDASAS